jgi:hypothetical protein
MHTLANNIFHNKLGKHTKNSILFIWLQKVFVVPQFLHYQTLPKHGYGNWGVTDSEKCGGF